MFLFVPWAPSWLRSSLINPSPLPAVQINLPPAVFIMPYTVGLHSAIAAFLSAGFATQFTIAVVAFLLIVFLTSALETDDAHEPEYPPGFSLFQINAFFGQRYDFINWAFHATGQNVFQLKLLRNKVIVVSGEQARQKFFTSKGLDLTEGFKILSGAIPLVRGVTSDLKTRQIATIHKRMVDMQKNASLSTLLPHLLDDTRATMEKWGSSGIFDPFENVYELTFRLTLRSLSSSEVVRDPALVSRLKRLYDQLDAGTTPASVLLPWLPTPAMIRKLWATKEIYTIISKVVRERAASGKPGNDTLQMLLDAGDEHLIIVGFIMGLLVAGARATGTTASWLFTFLGGNQHWRSEAAAEVESLLDKYSPSSTCTDASSASLSLRLSSIPLEAWENEVPVLDAIIRETTRIAQPHAAMRRNLGPELYINNKIIPTEAYVVYPFSDVHLDPEIYPDPWRFDPGRKEATNALFAYVGWGGGKTTCLGNRLAKVELKLITAMFVLCFRHSVVDKSGTPLANLPLPNWNDTFLCRPAASFCVKYDRTNMPL